MRRGMLTMTRELKRTWVLLAVTALLVMAPPGAGAEAPGPDASRCLAQLHSSLDLDPLSAELWPGWTISGTPIVLVDEADCWLLGDIRQFSEYAREPFETPELTVHSAALDSDGISQRDATVGGEPAAFISTGQMSTCIVPATFEAAFKTHLQTNCPELGAPDDPLVGAPSQPRDVALADIEREIALAAISADPDSVDGLIRDFVSVRSFRRAGMTGGFVNRERAREYRDGMAAYVRFRARELAVEYVDPADESLLTPSVKDTFCLKSWLCKPSGLDWYRNERFACMGAAVCYLLDRAGADWRSQVVDRCVDPYAVLWTQYMGGRSDVQPLLDRYGYTEREAEATSFIDATKSGPEKLFDEITREDAALFLINTEQLASTTVSYDREHIARVDPHREVHKRIIKIEFSGGTHVYVMGRQTAVVLGDDEFDFHQLMLEAPESYEITVGGMPFTPSAGINHLTGPLSVTANGFELEAQDAIIVSAEGRLSFVLHR